MTIVCSGKGKDLQEASIIMTARLLVKEMISLLQNVGGGKQALVIPLTEMSALVILAQLLLLAPEIGLKVSIMEASFALRECAYSTCASHRSCHVDCVHCMFPLIMHRDALTSTMQNHLVF